MAEWILERGIAETRALLVEGEEVIAAKIHWPGELAAGDVCSAKLVSSPSGLSRGVAALESGTEVLVDHLPRNLTEGADFTLRVSRAPIAERGRHKRAHGRYVPKDEAQEVSRHAAFAGGSAVHQFPAGWWEEVWASASSATLEFAGGEIVCSPTAAMTLIDIDGDLPPLDLALASIEAVARAIYWFDIGGNIGIDFPTITAKADRRKVDSALAQALSGWPHERTAMNGFGFVQLVARLEGPSLLDRFATSRVGLCARSAMRVAERAQGAGPVLLLRVHPALKAKIKPEWIEELAPRTGREVRMESDPGLALEAPQAQILSQ